MNEWPQIKIVPTFYEILQFYVIHFEFSHNLSFLNFTWKKKPNWTIWLSTYEKVNYDSALLLTSKAKFRNAHTDEWANDCCRIEDDGLKGEGWTG